MDNLMEYIYHITLLENFEKIVNRGIILSKNRIVNERIDYVSIAYEGIQERRSTFPVPLSPYGVLHDYIPFHFAPRSPMLYCVYGGTINGCNKSQQDILYLVVKIKDIKNSDLQFVFTDGHPIVSFSIFYNELSELKESIDWSVMRSKYWNDTSDDGDRKRRRQSEFLIHNEAPVNLIYGIGVYNNDMMNQVNSLLQRNNYQIPCKVKREWYY